MLYQSINIDRSACLCYTQRESFKTGTWHLSAVNCAIACLRAFFFFNFSCLCWGSVRAPVRVSVPVLFGVSVSLYLYLYLRLYLCLCVYVYLYLCTYICACICTCICTCICVCTCICTCIYTRACIFTCICTYIVCESLRVRASSGTRFRRVPGLFSDILPVPVAVAGYPGTRLPG